MPESLMSKSLMSDHSSFHALPLLDQTQMPLISALQTATQWDHAPFYMPGHKRGQGSPAALVNLLGQAALAADLPELPGLDNLFAATGVIQAAQALAADAFGAERTWFLVNGSTGGVEAMILATCSPGDKIILPRNVHRSAISGLILSGAAPIFVQPDYDPELDIAHSLTPAAIAQALAQHGDAKAVMLVSPTYYGVCGNISAIAELAHAHDLPLLVDEAHGPHFAFHPDLPTPALQAGADLVVQSVHKVLAGLTQSALLHRQGHRVDCDRVCRALSLIQSTSPNYLLLASLDAARQQMATTGKELMTRTLALAEEARRRIAAIPYLSVLDAAQVGRTPGFFQLDATRLTVDVSRLSISGFEADEWLCDRGQVIAEIPAQNYLTFIISLGNTPQDIDRLVQGFQQLSRLYPPESEPATTAASSSLFDSQDSFSSRDLQDISAGLMPSLPPSPPAPLTPRQAFFAATTTVALEDAIGQVSAELVCPYPPGIPVLLPGEQVTRTAVELLQRVLAAGGLITGCADAQLQTLKVVRQ
jgi:arginine/lysine/ornithine decarboxylase